ncbi:MAG: hypothetical protein KDK36_04020 [Leptospiraceae bacterium]|nr:hypothetical protein [Leptospiraceae bacterium]
MNEREEFEELAGLFLESSISEEENKQLMLLLEKNPGWKKELMNMSSTVISLEDFYLNKKKPKQGFKLNKIQYLIATAALLFIGIFSFYKTSDFTSSSISQAELKSEMALADDSSEMAINKEEEEILGAAPTFASKPKDMEKVKEKSGSTICRPNIIGNTRSIQTGEEKCRFKLENSEGIKMELSQNSSLSLTENEKEKILHLHSGEILLVSDSAKKDIKVSNKNWIFPVDKFKVLLQKTDKVEKLFLVQGKLTLKLITNSLNFQIKEGEVFNFQLEKKEFVPQEKISEYLNKVKNLENLNNLDSF